jgi:CDP-4-dehydro-6-deoxyglucose reductase
VTVDLEPLERLSDLDIKTIPSQLALIDRLRPDIVTIVFKTPPASPMRFAAWQYVDIVVHGVRRRYSLANAPRADGLLELLVNTTGRGDERYWFEHAQVDTFSALKAVRNLLLREEGPTNIIS